MPNRLAAETSPYLQQHRDNPVDWYPWGEEAFARARAEDKPVFLSIGYAACHWCHVMAHESFESEAVAARMNELFINVKVDREELPDVDAIYMRAIHVMGEGGGWPLSAFLVPDGRPYFVGTYFPPADRYGRPGFGRLLEHMAKAYRDERDKVLHNTEAVMDGLRHLEEHGRRTAQHGLRADLDEDLIIAAGRALADKADPVHGGLGDRPKFPSSTAQALMGRAAQRKFGGPARAAFLKQCTQMARGGIYDQLGGGFARYSVDEKWLVPHFEKMLYDNGQLLAIYGDAFAMSGDRLYREVIVETTAWLEREMSSPSGGLFASLDADSEGEEGKFYVFTPRDTEEALGIAAAIQFNHAYGITVEGNFEAATSVVSRVTPRGSDAEEAELSRLKLRLRQWRDRRVRPATDTKILAGWNGLAVTGLVRAWEATGHEPCLALAQRVLDFVLAEMVSDGGARIDRVWQRHGDRLDGTLDDYAFVARACLDLASASGEQRYFAAAHRLAGAIVSRFYEERDGLGIFYLTAAQASSLLIHRPESSDDGAIPAGAAVACEVLLEVGMLGGAPEMFSLAENYLRARAAVAAGNVFGGAQLLVAIDSYLSAETIFVSEGGGAASLRDAVRRHRPSRARLVWPWGEQEVIKGKGPSANGQAQVYVCSGQTCSAPASQYVGIQVQTKD